jgi:hypothetical protein
MTNDRSTDDANSRAAAAVADDGQGRWQDTDDGLALRALLPVLERQQRVYDARMRDREGAVKLAAIANLPIGWLFEDPRRQGDDLILRPTGPEGEEIEVSGRTSEGAWLSMAESLATLGEGS